MSTSSLATVKNSNISNFLATWIGYIIVGCVLVAVSGVTIYVIRDSNMEGSGLVGPLVSLFVATLFALAPLVACFVRTTSLDRRSKKLDGMVIPEIKATEYF
jgi:hypothetical protein